MKKKIISAIFAILVCVVMTVPSVAAVNETATTKGAMLPRVYDQADILTESEESSLLEKVNEISERHQCDVAILTMDTLDGTSAQSYADEYYDYCCFGYGDDNDGILFLLSIEENEWAISTEGLGTTALTADVQEYIIETMSPSLSDKKYFDAFTAYADLCDDAINKANGGGTEITVDVATMSSIDIVRGRTIPDERLMPRVVDEADILTDIEESNLLEEANRISQKQNCDVVILTIYSLEEYTATEYADDYYDYSGFGYGSSGDGILFLVSMEDRDWAISTKGFGITAFTDAGQEYMMENIKPDLSDGDYYDAFETYTELCDDFISQAKSGNAYDNGNLPQEPLSLIWIPISILIGVVFAFFITGVMKGKLKSVRSQPAASSYLKKNSMVVTTSKDTYLYSSVTRVPRNTGNSSGGGSSTHRSSSGSSHGGSSGKF